MSKNHLVEIISIHSKILEKLNKYSNRKTLHLLIMIAKQKTIQLNIYDEKTISCVECGRCIGEVEYDAEIIRPKCGKCANPMPEGDDKLSYTVNAMNIPN